MIWRFSIFIKRPTNSLFCIEYNMDLLAVNGNSQIGDSTDNGIGKKNNKVEGLLPQKRARQ